MQKLKMLWYSLYHPRNLILMRLFVLICLMGISAHALADDPGGEPDLLGEEMCHRQKNGQEQQHVDQGHAPLVKDHDSSPRPIGTAAYADSGLDKGRIDNFPAYRSSHRHSCDRRADLLQGD